MVKHPSTEAAGNIWNKSVSPPPKANAPQSAGSLASQVPCTIISNSTTCTPSAAKALPTLSTWIHKHVISTLEKAADLSCSLFSLNPAPCTATTRESAADKAVRCRFDGEHAELAEAQQPAQGHPQQPPVLRPQQPNVHHSHNSRCRYHARDHHSCCGNSLCSHSRSRPCCRLSLSRSRCNTCHLTSCVPCHGARQRRSFKTCMSERIALHSL
jgi:hypothetical protein